MDIELADGQCFEIFKSVDVNSPVIFTTSYDEYALHAFKVNSIDYLLKPVQKEDLIRALNKYHRLKKPAPEQWMTQTIESIVGSIKFFKNREQRSRFLVKQGQRWLTIETAEIAWFYAEGKICFLRTWNNQRYVLDYTLEQLVDLVDPELFYKVNRSYLVHARSIRSFQNYFNGKLILLLEPAPEQNDVIISKEKAMEFKKWMGK